MSLEEIKLELARAPPSTQSSIYALPGLDFGAHPLLNSPATMNHLKVQFGRRKHAQGHAPRCIMYSGEREAARYLLLSFAEPDGSKSCYAKSATYKFLPRLSPRGQKGGQGY